MRPAKAFFAALNPSSLRGRFLVVSLSASLFISLMTAYMVGSFTFRNDVATIEKRATEDAMRTAVSKKQALETRLNEIEKGLLTFASNPDLGESAYLINQHLAEVSRTQTLKRSVPETEALRGYYQRQAEAQGMAANALDAYQNSLDAVGARLQYQALLDPVTKKDWRPYWQAHDRIDPFIQAYRISFPWYDVLLLDPATGRVIYSAVKEIDFGAQATQGPLANTSIAEIFRSVRAQTGAASVVFRDYVRYAPSGNRSALFVGAPVRRGKELVGVLIGQVDSVDIDNRLSSNEQWNDLGLGDKGDLFLVGPDQRLRSTSRLLEAYWRQPGRHTAAEIPEHWPSDIPAPLTLHQAPQDQASVWHDKTANLLGRPSFHATTKIQHLQLDWDLHVFVDQAEVMHAAEAEREQVLWQALLAGLVTLAVSGLISLAMAESLSRPIRRLSGFLHHIQQSGDFWQRPPAPEAHLPSEILNIHQAVDSFLLTLQAQRQQERASQLTLKDERKQLLNLSHQHETLLSAIGEHALVASTDLNGRITYVNQRFQSVTQFQASELVGLTHAFLSSNHHNPSFYAEIWATIGGGKVWHGEICNRKKDGTLYWVESAIVPMRNELGDFIGYTAVSIDITERKQDIARIHANLATLRALLESIPYPVFLKDTQSRYVECNDAFCAMLQQSRSAILGKTPYDIAPRELADSYIQADQAAFASASGQQIYENTVVNPQGQVREVMFHKQVHFGQDGRPEGLVGIIIDVTDFRNSERELRKHHEKLQELVDERTVDLLHAKEEAERANQAKSEFLANITHELRTPLHAVISFTRLAQTRVKANQIDEANEFLDDIYSAGQRQLSLVNDLLDLAKVEAGQLSLTLAEHNIQTLLETTVRGLGALLDAKHQHIVWAIETDEVNAWVDMARIQQVFTNLLANAVKFSPESTSITLRITRAELAVGRRESDPPTLPALRVEVQDAGIGIPESDLDNIFNKFVQSQRTKSGSGGTGLGLAICREIIRLHAGRIQAHNNPHGGATFCVLLPLHPHSLP